MRALSAIGNRRRAAASLVATFGCFGGGAEALAQTEGAEEPAGAVQPIVAADGRTEYPKAFFDSFLPNNANDMVQKLPGFTFSKGDDVRGFAGAAGNVLVDGVRPTSKSVPLDQLLQRIPARSIARLEIIRGGAPGVDMQGQPVVANVVRAPGGESITTFQGLVKPYQDGQTGLVGRIEQSFRQGAFSSDSLFMARDDKHTDSGLGHIVRYGNTANERGVFDTDVQQDFYQGNGSFEYRLPGGDVAHINFGGERSDITRHEFGYPISASTGLEAFERTRIKLRNDKGELGGDYRHVFTGWLSGQVILLKTLKKDVQRAYVDGRSTVQAAFEEGDASETIGRTSLTFSRSARVRIEVGAEGAMNSLTSAAALSTGGVAIVVPSANVRIEEKRGEVFGTLNLRPTDRLSAEMGLRAERSTIEQSGGANQSRTFSFPKPRLILAYSPDSQSQVRFRIERTVGQLNFKDFAASSTLEAGTVNAGNPNLQPERAWVFEAAVERRFWGGGAAVITASHSEVQQVADWIPVRGFDAPGNLGDGRRQELKFALTLPLDKFGIRNGQFRFNGTWRWSRVKDPVTGIERRISGQKPFEGDFYIGKRIPSLKSSINLDGVFGFSETFYRLSEIRRNQDQPLLKIYWDWAPRSDLNFRFQIENITSKDRKRHRTLFAGPRSNQQVNVREERTAELKPFLMFRVRKTI